MERADQMTNAEKRELRQMVKAGHNIEDIMECVFCARSTVRLYIKVLGKPSQLNKKEPTNE